MKEELLHRAKEQATSTSIETQAYGTLDPHALAAEAILLDLKSVRGGLASSEAAERLRTHGRNELPPPPRRHPLARFLFQFHNALIYFLIAASIAAWALGHIIDAGVIVVVVLVNAVVGFVQEEG